ncbi:MAG: prohibitin family protein, partial [Candidatus Saccharibacteria bacterium]|nr:prohibitin family protein [Candidatus Saccharibacteria bacterium]
LSEGMSFVAPFGIESVTRYDVKTQNVEAGVAAATKDLQDVNAVVVLNYQLARDKVSEVHQRVGKDYQSVIIDPQIQELFKSVSAKYTANELITSRPEVKKEFFDHLKSRLGADKRYIVQDVSITNFKFSDEFNKAIEAVQIANQKIAQARQELETARVNAEKTITEAKAQAEAQRVKQQSLTRELLQQEAIKRWDGHLPTYATDGSTFFNLPVRG